MLKRLISLLAFVLVVGCGKTPTVNSDAAEATGRPLHHELRVIYREDNKTVTYFAQARLDGPNGATVRLQGPMQYRVGKFVLPLHDGDAPDAPRIYHQGTYYEYEEKVTDVKASYDLVFIKTAGKEQIVTLPMASSIRISKPTERQEISLGKKVPFVWEGPALAEGETVWLRDLAMLFSPDTYLKLPVNPGKEDDLRLFLSAATVVAPQDGIIQARRLRTAKNTGLVGAFSTEYIASPMTLRLTP